MAEDDRKGIEAPAQGAFLSRWARRKNAAATGTPEPELDELAARAEQAAAEERAERERAAAERAGREAENRAAAEAVDLDTADETTDFKPFMKDGVPKALRQAALRKLWSVNPVITAIDGLDDYNQDFNVTDTILTKFESAWKAGRGYRKKTKEEVSKMIEAGEARAEADRAEADARSDASAEQAERADAERDEAFGTHDASPDGSAGDGFDAGSGDASGGASGHSGMPPVVPMWPVPLVVRMLPAALMRLIPMMPPPVPQMRPILTPRPASPSAAASRSRTGSRGL
ncbi:DUF3306 domain-containing protein [Breoghania sp. L-A4]|uniref:DUF3306 domain-containing protein n=1 Tax=Breoghania sp. L-A4 TaxID=2304600 RepID=UPI000E35C72F|nr:DUF3306 domain-containing protein [Breoghania sp. L-A4]AXS40155.1 DUF3306 domain-containing protein [Breoghania sp. L-A4]